MIRQALRRIAAAFFLCIAPSIVLAAPKPCGCGGPCKGVPQLVRLPSGWAVLGDAEVWPTPVKTATQAAALWRAGNLHCEPPMKARTEDLRSVSGQGVGDPVFAPAMAPQPGAQPATNAPERAYARVLKLATFSRPQDAQLPVVQGPLQWVAVPGGHAQARSLSAPVFGRVGQVFGPVLRLGPGSGAPAAAGVDVSGWVGPQAALRWSIDRPRPPASEIEFQVPGVGRWTRSLAPRLVPALREGSTPARMAVAHGVLLGFSAASILVTVFDVPECKVLCGRTPPFAVDANYLLRFQNRSGAEVRRDTNLAAGLDLSMAAVALLSTLVPSARHGLLSRWEILEDALILGEGVLVAYTTPLSLEARLARARPIAFHPELGSQSSARTVVGPPLLAYRANRAGAWFGGVVTMLIVEDAPSAYTAAAGLLLGGMAAATAYYEVRAGLAYPTDAPVSLVYGAINGAGTVLWHRLFWGQWPGAKSRGRLRLQGVSLMGTRGGASASARLSF